jgi:hypothetical protein
MSEYIVMWIRTGSLSQEIRMVSITSGKLAPTAIMLHSFTVYIGLEILLIALLMLLFGEKE